MKTSRVRVLAVLAVIVVALLVVGVRTLTDGGSSATTSSSSSSGDPSSSGGSSPDSTPSGDAGLTPVKAPTLARLACAKNPDTTVRTATQLQDALDSAKPGTSIHLSNGTYAGEFVARTSGTAAKPIELCGSAGAVLSGGPIDGGYTLHLDGADHWRVLGFSIRGGQKGLMADSVTGDLIDGISVSHVGDEAIHLRATSTDNVVQRSTVRDTGLRKPQYGEGIYIGTAQSNWCDVSGCKPDRSDHNLVRDNDVAQTTAESVDIKEGTTGGTLADNTFSGVGMTEGDSWVDVKGNDWTIRGNTGTTAPEDGMQVHQILDRWGQRNTFTDNRLTVDGDGYGINVTKRHDDNVVACSNVAKAAAKGLSTIDCT
jgi:hypothetical protein